MFQVVQIRLTCEEKTENAWKPDIFPINSRDENLKNRRSLRTSPRNGWKDSWSFETSFLTQTLRFAFVDSVLWFYHAKQKFKNNKNPGPIRSNVPPNPPPGLLLGIFFPPFTGNDTVRERPSPWTRAGGVKNSKWNSPSFTDVFQKTKRELTTKKQVDDWTLSTRKSRSWKFGCARGTLVFQDSCGYVPKRHLPFW